jgi:hypothetical protein
MILNASACANPQWTVAPQTRCPARAAQSEPNRSMESLFAILVLLLLGWFWLDSLRARELATEISRAACDRQGLQHLDQTVALRKIGVRRTWDGLRLRRVYRFDFSEEGVGRRSGYVVLVGIELEEVSLGLPEDTLDA